MELERALLFSLVILLLGNAIDCKKKKIYSMRLVKNIVIPQEHDKSYFEMEETDVNNIVDEFEDDERLEMCQHAMRQVEKRIEGGSVEFLEFIEFGELKQYAVDVRSDSNPQLAHAFLCPTTPPIYLQVLRQNGELLVYIIVRYSDMKSLILCADDMCYEIKFVEDILPVSPSEISKFKDRMRREFDTNDLTEELRLRMCQRASTVGDLSNRNFRYLENSNTDVRRIYTLTLEKRGRDIRTEVVYAFRCPVIPALYLEVHEMESGDQQRYSVAIIMKKGELPPKFNEMNFHYQLKEVLSISKRSAPVVTTSREKFFNLLRPFIFPGSMTAIDPTRFTDLQRFRMCREAIQEMHQRDGLHFEFVEDVEPGKSEYYRVYFTPGKPKEVQAFKCPTKPTLYISIADRTPSGQNVWVMIVETESLNIVGYQMKTVLNISIVSARDTRKLSQSSAEVRDSSIDTDQLSVEKRNKLCEKATQMISGINVRSLSHTDTKLSRYYTLETSESNRDHVPDGEESEIQITERRIVEAFKCETDPEIFLHITAREGGGNILWIITKEAESISTLDFVGYQTKVVRDISEASLDIVRETPAKNVEESAINTNRLPEAKRQQMCRTALDTLSSTEIEYLVDTRTGDQKYYVLDVESLGESGRSSFSHYIIQAFPCPTEPPLYLHVNDEEDGLIVWIIVKDNRPLLDIESLRYETKVVVNIEEISERELQTEHPGSIAKSVINTDRLSEEERLLMCSNAVQKVTDIEVELLDDTTTEKQKFYALKIEPRQGTKKSPLLLIFAQAFKCSTEPPIYLHINDVKDVPGLYVWIIIEENKSLPSIDLTSYYFTLVKIIALVPVSELTSAIRRSIEKRGVVDTNKFPEKYRSELCEKATLLVSADQIELDENAKTGRSLYYNVTVESDEYNKKYSVIQGFKCPTSPALYLEVRELVSKENSILVFAQKNDFVTESNDICYIVNFLDRIVEASSSEMRVYGSPEYDDVDFDQIPYTSRLKMCKEASTHSAFNDRHMEFSPEDQVEDKNFYSLFSQSEVHETTPVVVQAIRCPTVPTIYLQLFSWESQKRVVFINVKKTDTKRLNRELRGSKKIRERSQKSEVDESKIRKTPRQPRRMFSESEESTHSRSSQSSWRYRGPKASVKAEGRKQRSQPDDVDEVDIRSTSRQSQTDNLDEENTRRASRQGQTDDLDEENKRRTSRQSQPDDVDEVNTRRTSRQQQTYDESDESSELNEPGSLRGARRYGGPQESVYAEERKQRSQSGDVHKVRMRSTSRRQHDELEESRGVDEPGSSRGARRFGEAEESIDVDEQRQWSQTEDVDKVNARSASRRRQADDEDEVYAKRISRPQRPTYDESEESSELNDPGSLRGARRFRGTEELTDSVERQLREAITKGTVERMKVKYVEQIDAASEQEHSLMPSGYKEQSMIDTDKYYTDKQLLKMCRSVIESLQEEEDITLLRKQKPGKSKFYVIQEKSLENRISEFKMVRAFLCPTAPEMYLGVRFKKEKGITVTAILKEEDHNGSEIVFELKIVDTITEIVTNRASSFYSMASTTRTAVNTDDFSEGKRVQMCKRGLRMIRNIMESQVEFLKDEPLGGSRYYILDMETEFEESVRAFKCPCDPPIYLEVHGPQNIGYTIVYVIWEYNKEAEEIQEEDDEVEEVEEVISVRSSPPQSPPPRRKMLMAAPLRKDKIIYAEKYVTDIITEALGTLFDAMDRVSVDTDSFSVDERLQMCAEAMKLFPNKKFKLDRKGKPGSCRAYTLLTDSRSENVRGFECPTTPTLLIQVIKNGAGGYSAWAITKKKRKSKPSSVSSSHIEDMPYTVLLVDEIIDLEDHDESSYEPLEFPKPFPVTFTQDQRAKICDHGVEYLPEHESIIRFSGRKPSKDDDFYIINFISQSRPQKKVISAYKCPTKPAVFIELYMQEETEEDLQRVAARVIIKRLDLPVKAEA